MEDFQAYAATRPAPNPDALLLAHIDRLHTDGQGCSADTLTRVRDLLVRWQSKSAATDWIYDVPTETGRYGILYRVGRRLKSFVADYDPADGWLSALPGMDIIAYCPLPAIPTNA